MASRNTKSLRETAYHEAGHYVAKWALVGDAAYGDTLTIVPNRATSTLGTNKPLYEDDETEEGRRAYIVSLYAGAAAQSRVFSDLEAIREGARSDDEQAGEYLPGVPESEQELRIQAQQLVDANWQAVERLADELLQHRTLDAEEAFSLVTNDMEALERWRRSKISRR